MFMSMGTAVGELRNMWNDMPGKNSLFSLSWITSVAT